MFEDFFKKTKKTQEELDAAFLKAAGEYNFGKAKKLLAQGANPLATDAEGNNALHKVAFCDDMRDPGDVDKFVYLLLDKNLDINALNKKGQTCLHLIAMNERFFGDGWRCPPEMVMDIFIERGADPRIVDSEGRTPLHLAAPRGRDKMADSILRGYPSLIAVQDNAGKYPHESTVEGPVRHHMLSRRLLREFDAYNAAKTPSKTGADGVSSGNWILLGREQAAHVTFYKNLEVTLTEIFNFQNKTYTKITQNLITESASSVGRNFDDIPSYKTTIEQAARELSRLQRQADEGKNRPKP